MSRHRCSWAISAQSARVTPDAADRESAASSAIVQASVAAAPCATRQMANNAGMRAQASAGVVPWSAGAMRGREFRTDTAVKRWAVQRASMRSSVGVVMAKRSGAAGVGGPRIRERARFGFFRKTQCG